MKARLFITFVLAVGLTLFLTEGVAAQRSEPGTPETPEQFCLPGIPCRLEGSYSSWEKSPSPSLPEGSALPWQKLPDGAYQTPDGLWVMSGDTRLTGAPQSIVPETNGGPDDYGYTWDDTVPFSWVDATTGTNTGLTGQSQQVGPIALPFSFKYYENTYNQVYVSTNGTLGFSGQLTADSQEWVFPNPGLPNNVIAPYWAPENASAGGIYYISGGTFPNRWWVVEWYQMRDYSADSRLTFEVVLFENGAIEFRYQTINRGTSGWWSYGVGIEDSAGLDGLKYTGSPANNMAVRFTRPTPSARASVRPLYQGRFTRAGATETFQVPIRNNGDFGADTYDLTTASPWPASLCAADGVTPLTDTDSDGTVDTGPVAQGSTFIVTIKAQTPNPASVGAANTVSVTARSSLNTAKIKTAALQSAVPAPFAQVYRDDADGAMSLYLAQPAGQMVRKATANSYYGYDMAVAETPGSNFVYAWDKGRCLDNSCNIYVRELEYILLNSVGNTIRAVSKLTDHSGATVNTYDYAPAVAVAANGRIGVLWYRYLYNSSNSQFNGNIWFAVLDAAGNAVVAPTNLTNNTAWGTWNDLNVPRFSSPQIAATGDNCFVLAWLREHQESGGWVNDIYYAVRDSGGGEILGTTRFTTDTPGTSGYSQPILTSLSSNRAFLSWFSTKNSDDDVYYAVISSDGSLAKSATNLSVDETVVEWGNYDAVQLSDGKILAVWEAWGCFPGEWVSRIRFALLDTSYNRIGTPTCLGRVAAATTGDIDASITADASGHAIITWVDRDSSMRRNLYYALVDGNGSVLSPPMIFRSSQATSPYIETSYEGYGNTSYNWTLPAGVDGYVTATMPVSGTVGGYARVTVSYGNLGGQKASTVVLAATLGAGLTYATDTSGFTPVVVGNNVQWNLPNLSLFDRGEFFLYVQVPGAAAVGTRLPINLSFTSVGPETNPADNVATAEVVASPPPGGPDDYGYTWDDVAPFNWMDATGGTDTGLSQGTSGASVTEPIDLGFTFKFYENAYTNLYISTAGAVGFAGSNLSGRTSTSYVPNPGNPNNFIAPYLAPLRVNSGSYTGRVYYLRGGAAPNRYMVIEWYQARDDIGGQFTFEVILYENGNIDFNYQSMVHSNNSYYCSSAAAIEDALGMDGLAYKQAACNNMSATTGKTVRFTRPALSARASIRPLYQGRFTRAGAIEAFHVPIRNTGELGADTYDLTTASPWSTFLYAADGATPLTDTDSDGTVDTGTVAQGSTFTVTVRVQTTNPANVGASNTVSITVRSSLNTGRSKTAALQTAIPAPFAQVYRDNADGAMSLYLAQPAGQIVRKTTANAYNGSNMAVAEMPSSFAYFWSRYRSTGSISVSEIEYALLDSQGNTMRAVSKLTDHSGATVRTYDYPAVAVAPNGRIGVLWHRYLYNSSNSQFNYNIWFAVLDAAGNVVVPPTNLTNNAGWGTSSDLNVPRFSSPQVAATGDNRFVLAWLREHREGTGWVDDIYYAVRDSGGREVWGITRLTTSTPGSDQHYYPNLAALNNNRALLTWRRSRDADIYYAVLGSDGRTVKAATNLVGDGYNHDDWRPDAVQQSDGNIVIAWLGCSYPGYCLRFAGLDASYNRIASPTTLDNPAAVTGNGYVSLAADAAGHAVLTWMDYDSGNRRNLYYALVDAHGNVHTPPTIFRTSQATSPYIETSYEGYGNTSYSWTPPAGVDGWVQSTALVGGPPSGIASIPVRYGNNGAGLASGVTIAVTLGAGLTYVSDTSGVSPGINGNVITWNLPDIVLLGSGQFALQVSIPNDPIGTRYAVTLMFSSAGPETNPADNSTTLQVMAANRVFLPLVLRNY